MLFHGHLLVRRPNRSKKRVQLEASVFTCIYWCCVHAYTHPTAGLWRPDNNLQGPVLFFYLVCPRGSNPGVSLGSLGAPNHLVGSFTTPHGATKWGGNGNRVISRVPKHAVSKTKLKFKGGVNWGIFDSAQKPWLAFFFFFKCVIVEVRGQLVGIHSLSIRHESGHLNSWAILLARALILNTQHTLCTVHAITPWSTSGPCL